ncbi:hypothetical protein [Roseibium aggregatum]|uniref:Uncharacterized protein n=1 Tax=Roseibium aggregatum TaxID=187304 RepID=A0A939EEF7_9HYPH|nr:hypothetical protein [Roseibium aggregatum]MBN9671269.1 hypothetical protein [Roseibium aggregatum]
MMNLKSLVVFDAVVCAAFGLLLIFGASLLERLTGIPEAFSFLCGLFLMPVAAFMAVIALRFVTTPPAVWVIVLGNAAWVAASLVLLTPGLIALNAFGVVFVLFQAVFVAVLACLEAKALLFSSPTAVER